MRLADRPMAGVGIVSELTEQLRPATRDHHRVLELRGPAAILRANAPAVRVYQVTRRAFDNDGFDRDHETLFQPPPGLRTPEKRPAGRFVHLMAHAVAGEVPHHVAAMGEGVRMHRVADIADAVPRHG